MRRVGAAEFNETPLVDVIDVSAIPFRRAQAPHNHVERGFWHWVIRRLIDIGPRKALRVTFIKPVTQFVSTGVYLASKKYGVKVSVFRDGRSAYFYIADKE